MVTEGVFGFICGNVLGDSCVTIVIPEGSIAPLIGMIVLAISDAVDVAMAVPTT